jgi:hypothetical protein
MKNKFKLWGGILAAVIVLCTTPFVGYANDQAEVRSVVQKVFEQLKTHDYARLYDVLPDSSRKRMSRERFVSALERAQDFYQLDRMEVGTVRVAGNLAVVDTVLFGRVVSPIQAEGKIAAQQYLVRENGSWRVATGDQSTVKKFLAANPGFSKGFTIRQPRVYVKQDNKWIEFNPGNKKKTK